jgi:hypothetical protein
VRPKFGNKAKIGKLPEQHPWKRTKTAVASKNTPQKTYVNSKQRRLSSLMKYAG